MGNRYNYGITVLWVCMNNIIITVYGGKLAFAHQAIGTIMYCLETFILLVTLPVFTMYSGQGVVCKLMVTPYHQTFEWSMAYYRTFQPLTSEHSNDRWSMVRHSKFQYCLTIDSRLLDIPRLYIVAYTVFFYPISLSYSTHKSKPNSSMSRY